MKPCTHTKSCTAKSMFDLVIHTDLQVVRCTPEKLWHIQHHTQQVDGRALQEHLYRIMAGLRHKHKHTRQPGTQDMQLWRCRLHEGQTTLADNKCSSSCSCSCCACTQMVALLFPSHRLGGAAHLPVLSSALSACAILPPCHTVPACLEGLSSLQQWPGCVHVCRQARRNNM